MSGPLDEGKKSGQEKSAGGAVNEEGTAGCGEEERTTSSGSRSKEAKMRKGVSVGKSVQNRGCMRSTS